MNSDIFIPIRTALLMPKAQYMTYFMYYNPEGGTTKTDGNILNIVLNSSNIRTASVKKYIVVLFEIIYTCDWIYKYASVTHKY